MSEEARPQVSYKAGEIGVKPMGYMKVTSNRAPTEPIRADSFGVIVWGNNSKKATGAAMAWGDVLRMAVHAATHNSAARADLEAALAAIPAETKEEG